MIMRTKCIRLTMKMASTTTCGDSEQRKYMCNIFIWTTKRKSETQMRENVYALAHRKQSLFIQYNREWLYLFILHFTKSYRLFIYGINQCSIHEFYMIDTRCWQLILWNRLLSCVKVALAWNRFLFAEIIEYSIFAETTFVSRHLKFS